MAGNANTLVRRSFLTLFLLFASSAMAQAAVTSAAADSPARSWQSVGSEIPADPAWHSGVLANGLRYAVRRGAKPPGGISVRVRIDAGAMMETDVEQGWTHLLEHMLFRGTEHVPDGKGIRIWQRLGASFGTDTNAATTRTATTFVLDLPKGDAAAYREALTVLAEMMHRASIDPALLDTERKVVLAERALRRSPLNQKVRAIGDPLMLAGTTAATRDIDGSEVTLSAATAERLRAYYKRWYRPARAVVVVVGDADPAMLEAEVRRSFGAWTAEGPEPAEPAYGSPVSPPRRAAVVTDPQLTTSVRLSYVTPHDERPWTIARQQRQFLDWVAIAILRQRLSTEAQKDEAITGADTDSIANRHIQDQVTVTVTAKPGAWQAALDRTAAILNGARTTPPSQAEIDQEVASITTTQERRVVELPTAPSAYLADEYVGDIDQGDVTAPKPFYRDLWLTGRPMLTRAAVGAAIRRLLAPQPRLIVYSPTPVAGGDAAALAALARIGTVAAARYTPLRAVALSDLKLTGTPARVLSSSTIADLGIERVHFSNGVELDLKQTAWEKDSIRVSVMIGHGLAGARPDESGLDWTEGVLLYSGFGPFSADEVRRLSAGRRVGFGINGGMDGLFVSGFTDRADVSDMLLLMTGAITQMRYEPTPIARLREGWTAGYQSIFGKPGSVFDAFGSIYLYGGDTRFRGTPPLGEIEALTPAAFRDYWQHRLAEGPVKVGVVGDFDRAAIIAAVACTLGTLAPRADIRPDDARRDVRATPPARTPVILRHRGDGGQAMVARIWPTTGFLEDVPTARALSLAASVIQTQLTERFRAKQGGSYAPFASYNDGGAVLDRYGLLLAGAQLRVDRIGDFDAALTGIIADLVAHGPDADAFTRARATAIASTERMRSNNPYWLAVINGDLDDRREVDVIRNAVASRAAVTPQQVQAAVARFLRPGAKSFDIQVLPEPAAAKAN